ncbi:MAG: hypothetical protein SO132_02700 [Candidatus Enteromonas sp.]|nr:hypothetical protein [Candidatus Enteromonas sp.]
MKKKNLMLFALTISSLTVLASCGQDKPAKTDGEKTTVELAVEDAMTLTRDELFKKAADELGTSGKLKFLATTSRGGKDDAKNAFIAELQKHNPGITSPLEYSTTVDGKIYTTLLAEIENNVKDGYSGAILQDGYQLGKNLDTFVNYIPKEWKEATGVNIERDGDPFALQYNFKTWMANNKNGDTVIDNVWDVTASKYKGKLDTMDPRNENVNMDWLIMLTSDEECDKLKAAYEDASNDNKNIDFSTYASYGEKQKYAYAFIDKFIENAVFHDDDGKAVNKLAQTPGDIGWIVYSKIQNVKESEAITKANLVIGALGSDNDNGATKGASSMKGFGGFMYKHYPTVMPNAKYPYATCAFINLLSTTETGYSVWAVDVGDYPTMPSINKDRTKNGYVDGVNKFPCLNDPTSDWWNDASKGAAVIETPSYIKTKYNSVMAFITRAIAAK